MCAPNEIESPAALKLDAVEPLLAAALTFDREEYHESEGVPVKEACRLAAVCTAWRAAVVALGGRRFLTEQTRAALRVKVARMHGVRDYFESYFGNGLPVPFGCHRPSAEAVRKQKELDGWVNDRLRAMRAHCRELQASEAALERVKLTRGSG